MMEIQSTKHSNGLELRLSGRLDASQAIVLDSELQEIVRSGEHRIHLNMADVGYISSAGIRILIKYAKMLNSLGGSFQIDQPSAMVREILAMTGLEELFGSQQAQTRPGEEADKQAAGEWRQYGRLRCRQYRVSGDGSLSCHLVGDPGKLGRQAFSAQDATSLAMPAGRFALGLGALGTGFDDCQPRYGEFLAAGGCIACLPSDDPKTPDYLVATGALIPEVRVLYAMVGEGPLPVCVRFEAEDPDAGVPLSEVVAASVGILNVQTIGMVMIAETSGLIGASLRRSPALGEADAVMFDHPGIRRWISLTPERVCDRTLALVTGFAATAPPAMLAPFVRPLGEPPAPAGHFHAAAFSYRALPEEAIPLQSTVACLFENQTLNALLHLVNDNRPIAGAGESLFVRGAIWLGAVQSLTADRPQGKDAP